MGIWIPSSYSSLNSTSNCTWELFQEAINDYGKLCWTFSKHSTEVDFLDITIVIPPNLDIQTQLNEKAMNLYLYLPLHTAHPPGTLSRTFASMLLWVHCLTSNINDIVPAITKFYKRLCAYGYTNNVLHPLFSQHFVLAQQLHSVVPSDSLDCLYLHVPYHPMNPPARKIQYIFHDTMLSPLGEPHLQDLQNLFGQAFGVQ